MGRRGVVFLPYLRRTGPSSAADVYGVAPIQGEVAAPRIFHARVPLLRRRMWMGRPLSRRAVIPDVAAVRADLEVLVG